MLKKIIDNLEDVEEKYRALYTEENGKFVLDKDIVGDGEQSGLKENTEKLKAEKLRIQAELDSILKDQKEKEADELSAKGEYEKLLAIKTDEFEKSKEQLTTRADKAETALKDSLISLEVSHIASELFADPETFQHLVAARVQAVEVDGKTTVQITDANGNPSPTMTAEHLIAEFKGVEKYKNYIKGVDSSGGGAGGGSGGGGGSSAEWEKYFKPNTPEYSPIKQGELQKSDESLYKTLSKKYGLDDPYNIQQPVGVGVAHGHR